MKIKTSYINHDKEMGPYYEAWLSPYGKMPVEASGKTEKQAIAALKKAVKLKAVEARQIFNYYNGALNVIEGIQAK